MDVERAFAVTAADMYRRFPGGVAIEGLGIGDGDVLSHGMNVSPCARHGRVVPVPPHDRLPALQGSRREQVVGVQERHERLFGVRQPGVAGRRQTGVAAVPQRHEPAVACRKGRCRRGRLVGGRIVDDVASPGVVRLPPHRLEAIGQPGAAVVHRHHDGDGERAGRWRPDLGTRRRGVRRYGESGMKVGDRLRLLAGDGAG